MSRKPKAFYVETTITPVGRAYVVCGMDERLYYPTRVLANEMRDRLNEAFQRGFSVGIDKANEHAVLAISRGRVVE